MQEQTPTPPEKVVPEKVLFTWKAPTRMAKKRGREFWVKLVAIVSLLAFIFFIAEGIMPAILLLSVIFLFYVMTTIEPEIGEYSITNKGLGISGRKNPWSVFRSFSFFDRENTKYLTLNMNVIPGRIDLIINDKDEKKVKETLEKFIPVNPEPKTRFDRASDWVSDKLS